MKYIGCVVLAEILEVEEQQRNFDEKKFVRALRALPKLPWDTEYKASKRK